MEMHWLPASSFCEPCAMNFDYILRFEDLDEEEPVFRKHLGLEDVLVLYHC